MAGAEIPDFPFTPNMSRRAKSYAQEIVWSRLLTQSDSEDRVDVTRWEALRITEALEVVREKGVDDGYRKVLEGYQLLEACDFLDEFDIARINAVAATTCESEGRLRNVRAISDVLRQLSQSI